MCTGAHARRAYVDPDNPPLAGKGRVIKQEQKDDQVAMTNKATKNEHNDKGHAKSTTDGKAQGSAECSIVVGPPGNPRPSPKRSKKLDTETKELTKKLIPKTCKPAKPPAVAATPSARMHRGGGRSRVLAEDGRWFKTNHTPRDGRCLWHSLAMLATLTGLSTGQMMRNTLRTLRDMRDEVYKGMTYEEAVYIETGSSWQGYLADLRRGAIWPGVLEVRAAACFLQCPIVVSSPEHGTLKELYRTPALGGPMQPAPLHLAFLDGCHYEPITCDISGEELDHDAYSYTLLYGNISSFLRHHAEAYDLADTVEAEALLLTETRIRTGARGVRYEAEKRGFEVPQLSNPRPLKSDGSGPLEGGLYAAARSPCSLKRYALPPESGLNSDNTMHIALPMGEGNKAGWLNIILAYAHRDDEQHRSNLFEYGYSLGQTPTIIIGDLNSPTKVRGTRSAINKALATGWWHSCVPEGTSTSHKAGRPGADPDVVIANEIAKNFILKVEIDEQHSFPNHYPLVVRMRLPRTLPLIQRVRSTRCYAVLANGLDDASRQELADTALDLEDTGAITQLVQSGDHEGAWLAWCRCAEGLLTPYADTFAKKIPQPGDFREKGARATLEWVPAWQPQPTGKPRQLVRATFRLRRLQQLIPKAPRQRQQRDEEESWDLFLKLRRRLGDWDIDTFTETTWSDLTHEDCTKAMAALRTATHKMDLAHMRQCRLQWRERMATSLRHACTWTKFKAKPQPNLDQIDDHEGNQHHHAQEIADELLRRCKEKFEARLHAGDREALNEVLTVVGDSLKGTSEVSDLKGEQLWKKIHAKPRGAPGLDGWRPCELELLPEGMWTLLADILNGIEAKGVWPEQLQQLVHAALLKEIKTEGPFPRTKVRMLGILPVITRAWDGCRAQDIESWLEQWAPPEIHGGTPGCDVHTATLPVTAALLDCAGRHAAGVSLDYTDAFDRIPLDLTLVILRKGGLDERIVRAIEALYFQMLRWVTGHRRAAAGTFRAIIGVIQGLASSVKIINVWMSVFVIYSRKVMTYEVWDHHFITMSIYLDDRNIIASTAEGLLLVIQCATRFDQAFGAERNMGKTQIYGTDEETLKELQVAFPTAVVRKRAWSLGMPMATTYDLEDDPTSLAKVERRFTEAVDKAKAATCLPYDMRERALVAMVPATFGYGCVMYDCAPKLEKLVVRAIYVSLTGGSRPFGNTAILYTTLVRGHLLHPWFVQLRAYVAWMRGCSEVQGELYLRMRAAPPPNSPFSGFHALLEKLGCSWSAPLKYTAQALHTGLDVEVDFSRENSKKGLDHSMRETWRDAMMRIPHHRYDRAGTEWGIDHNETMTYSKELKKTGEFLRRGWLRTILLGDMRTPARMRTGGWLRTSEAKCSECDVLDSIGHRLVCPRNQDLREQLQLTVLQLQEWPVCFTRCGIVPRAWPNDFEEDTATRMQTYLVDINLRAHVHEHTKAIMELASLRIRARRKVHDDEDPEPHEDELSTLRAAVRGTKRVADDYDG